MKIKPSFKRPVAKLGTRLHKKPIKRATGQIKGRKGGIPVWLKCVPEGLHGSGSLQQRLWRLTSDYVRIRDWHQFEGKCVATGKKLETWNHGQAGHFKSYPKCNGMYKFHPDNIFLQSAYSNSFGDKDDWKAFEQEIALRYGIARLNEIEADNTLSPLKITTDMVLKDIERKISLIAGLPEQPEYWPRLIKLRALT